VALARRRRLHGARDRDVRGRRRQSVDLQDRQALPRAVATVSQLPRHPRLRSFARRAHLSERARHGLGRVRVDPGLLLPGYPVWPFALRVAASRIILGLHHPGDVLVGAAVGAPTAAVSFKLV
jgi:hypothetical protein